MFIKQGSLVYSQDSECLWSLRPYRVIVREAFLVKARWFCLVFIISILVLMPSWTLHINVAPILVRSGFRSLTF